MSYENAQRAYDREYEAPSGPRHDKAEIEYSADDSGHDDFGGVQREAAEVAAVLRAREQRRVFEVE